MMGKNGKWQPLDMRVSTSLSKSDYEKLVQYMQDHGMTASEAARVLIQKALGVYARTGNI